MAISGVNCHAELLGRLHHEPAGRFGGRVLERLGPQIVAADMMIDDDLLGLSRSRTTSPIGPNWAQALVSSTISTSWPSRSLGWTSTPIALSRCVGIDEQQGFAASADR